MSDNSTSNELTTRVIDFFKRKPVQPKYRPPPPKPRKTRRKKSDPNQTQDIFEIHDRILDILEEEFQQLPKLNQKAKRFQWITNNSDDDVECQIANNELAKLNTQIQLVESGFREAKYIYRTECILKEYNKLLNQPIKVDFMGNRVFNQHHRKQTIIIEFLNIAKDYISVQPVEGQRRSMLCDDCHVELQREDDFLFVCPLCGFAVKHFASVASYQENNRINVAQRYVYDKRAHFGDSIKKFQAKQNTTISDEVYRDLWDKLHSHDIPIERLTKDHLYEFLKLTGHSDHYEDITLIYCEMTCNTAPNISYLEQKLFALFDEIDPVYERVKPLGRVNFLNGQFVLFKLLQKLKYLCKEEDFYILKTREKMLEHDQIWKRICSELSWTYIATV
uniref:Late transcription factor 3-like protein n=1 Tax=Marseillevirus LCMAC202 TaxID=2506606 RepID=A0A481Z0K9_9VIRU|nr:MAG: late transcription factor 3-like protein [Marseillevirus LCMAC202]